MAAAVKAAKTKTAAVRAIAAKIALATKRHGIKGNARQVPGVFRSAVVDS